MKRILVLFCVLGLLAAACGSDSADTDAGSAGTDSESLTSEAVDDSGEDAGMAADESEGDEGGAAAGDVLDAAELDELLAATGEQTSGRFEATMEMTGGPTSEMPGPISIQFSGAFDEATASSEISMDMSGVMAAALEADPTAADDPDAAAAMAMMAPFFEEPMQIRTIGDRSWIKWGLLAMFGVGDKWLETDAQGSNDLTQDFGFDAETPADALSGLAESGHKVEFVGEEEIRGMTAARYRSVIDVASMTAEQRAAFGEQLPEGGSYTLDLWVADDLVQRFQIEMTDLEQTADNDIASVTIVYDLFDHGAAVDITPPPPAEVVTEAELGFDVGDFGGIGGTGGG
ncbi:MAG: hypothetical protein OES24_13500 [Acidimicrobiia bacterium]|nr:hypothetical protein [Acidimicrobiia bacterium]